MTDTVKSGEQFSSHWGLFSTLLGMAVGTGNIWRFTRELAINNGGAFIICTFIAIFVWAVPLICAESAFGKKTRMANAGAFKLLLGKRWTWMGAFCAMCCIMLGSYYGVVLGWVMKYIYLIATGFLSQVASGGGVELTTATWNAFATQPPSWGAMFWSWAALMIGAYIIYRGVQGGLETANNVVVPMIFVLLIILLVQVLMIPNAVTGLEYMFHVEIADFAKPRLWLAAFTQAAWSTGAGWGMYHVFFVYSAKDEDIQLNALTVVLGQTTAAMLAGMVVLPAVFALSEDPMSVMRSGSNGLTFVNLMSLFASVKGGTFMAAIFFFALFCAALSTLIAMLELGCRNLMDIGFTRRRGTIVVAAFFLIVGSFSALDNKIFENQDFTWGVALLMVGLFYSVAAMKYGIEKLWEEEIAPCSYINIKWMWSCIKLFPIIFLFVWGWWVYDAASWYPGEWFKFWPITSIHIRRESCSSSGACCLPF